MQVMKRFMLMTAVLLLSASLAFGAMTTAQIKKKLLEGLTTAQVLELALISGAKVSDVMAAAGELPAADALAAKKEVLAAAYAIVATQKAAQEGQAEETPSLVPQITFDEITEAGVGADVPLADVIKAAPPEQQAEVKQSIVSVSQTSTTVVISSQDIAVGLIGSGTDSEEVLNEMAGLLDVPVDEVDDVDVDAAVQTVDSTPEPPNVPDTKPGSPV